MKLGDLAHGREAADIFGVSRPEEVWRAVKRHAGAYPGSLTVHTVGRNKAVARDELQAFAAWYRENVHRNTRPGAVKPPQAIDGRRAALREAIRRIERQ